MLQPAIANEPDRAKRERLERRRNELLDEHLNPLYLEAHARTRDAVRELGATNYFELYRALRLRPRRARRPVPRAARLDRDACTSRSATGSSATARHAPRRGARWDIGPHDARADMGRGLPRGPDAAGARARRSKSLGIDLDAQENVHLDVEQRPHKTPRAFCAPIEVPGQGHARDQADGRRRRLARALPRGRACGALRAHVGRALGRGASASATTQSPRAGRCCSST